MKVSTIRVSGWVKHTTPLSHSLTRMVLTPQTSPKEQKTPGYKATFRAFRRILTLVQAKPRIRW